MKKIFAPGWRFVYTPTTTTATNYIVHTLYSIATIIIVSNNKNKILIEYVNPQVATAS